MPRPCRSSGCAGARSVFAEPTGEGDYLDLAWDRDKLARYGITVEQAQVILGGEILTTMIDGRARYPVNVRYMHDFRSDRDSIAHVLLPSETANARLPLVSWRRLAQRVSACRMSHAMMPGYSQHRTYLIRMSEVFTAMGNRARQLSDCQCQYP
jgi:Cu(I)/Ag(I) efflux system membrane protein CusA/SilA